MSAALGWIVVKVGGEVVASPHMAAIASDVVSLQTRGERLVLLHGGGPQATELQGRLGQTPRLVGGRRVTDEAALDVIKMVVAGKVNVDACAALLAAGGRPVGLHGASALAIEARKRPPRVVSGGGPDPVDFGHVGDVIGVNRGLLELLASAGYVPVVASLGADRRGAIFNINADAVAHALALGVVARALVLVSDVPGVLADVKDVASRVARLRAADARRAIGDGTVTRGMIPKLEEAFAALEAGVASVHIVGRLQPGELAREIEAPGSVGTVLVP
jgi:acetylglutamate kinase